MKDIDAIDCYQVIRLPQFIFLIVFEETNDTIEDVSFISAVRLCST